MRIAVRDDDLCYYSSYNDFRQVYDLLDIPVSASVVPFAVPNHGDSFPWGDYPRDQTMPISKNTVLVEAMKKDIQAGRLEVLQHGYSHEYKREGQRWIPEMIWKEQTRLEREISAGKAELEKAFDQPITVFVAPSQEIDKKGIICIERAALNYSGFPARLTLRPFSFKGIINICVRHFRRLRYGIPLGLLRYRKHMEVSSVPLCDLNEMKRVYSVCKRHGFDMVIVVHYWKLLQKPQDLEHLREFVAFVKSQNEGFSFVGDCFK